jgi:predicted ABC-type ATPase
MKDSDPKSPTVYVVAGVNGSGKTTFATEFLPEFANCKEFLNADLIASGLSPFLPEEQNMRAGRLLLSRIRELSHAKKSFGFETTLSGRTYLRLFSRMKFDGYRIVLYFLWLNNCDIALSRVANRVRQGGHHVPETDIRRRFPAGVYNLFHLYRPLLDEWRLFDASELPPVVIAGEKGGKLDVLLPDIFMQVKLIANVTEL